MHCLFFLHIVVADFDKSTFRKLGRIIQKVRKDLYQSVSVNINFQTYIFFLFLKIKTGCNQHLMGHIDVIKQFLHYTLLIAERHISGLDAGKFQNVINQFEQQIAILINGVNILLLIFRT